MAPRRRGRHGRRRRGSDRAGPDDRRLLPDSGGADRLVEAVTSRVGPRALPGALAGVAALIGLPLFFEVGVVLLVAVVLLSAIV
ncbi:GntT/GntP/DsdX family permease [Pseudonocardia humida]|uniref:GntT/GntP/DsdX family permease n=1 Tax=Pseudonocardia humida TaxID=2800819 RepID=UPI0027E25C46|nr:hypothetical protein [Pseudonocardia humida]